MGDLADIDDWRAIESAGGPLVLLPDRARGDWTGVAGDDYERACGVDGYLGVLDVGDDQALVIGDEPASTALLPTRAADSLVIAKWTYGPDRLSVVASLRGIRLDQFPAAQVKVTFLSSPQLLFDSGSPGGEADEHLTARLPAGEYVASTLVFEPARDISLVLHWVRRPAMPDNPTLQRTGRASRSS
jgi:hypothetical protein